MLLWLGLRILQQNHQKLNPICQFEAFERQPGMISVLAGKPNASVFPLTSFQFSAKSPFDQDKEDAFRVIGEKLTQALQYGPTHGILSLIEWMDGSFMKDGDLRLGVGRRTFYLKASSAVIQPGDYALIEPPAYALKANIIHTDNDGTKSTNLREILENWPESRPFPKILYTVPYRGNPFGATTSEERRRDILALARKYNFLIFEDDPYFYYYYGDSLCLALYFALEHELPEVGSVARFDSLSEIISGGFRIGFACGPEVNIDVVNVHTSISNLQASTFTQVIADTFLCSWGHEGFKKHAEHVAEFYRRIKLLLDNPSTSHTLRGAHDNPEGNSDCILSYAITEGVLPLPGISFMPDVKETPYVRVPFSQIEEDKIKEAVVRLAKAGESNALVLDFTIESIEVEILMLLIG
ncbi:PLP-dependent transferase [Fomitiporia mediterranea MF3/22]|uniref:PLP-dependent transferase n=1 Tax=Fomitiporia mediterranea (strain MF3/22) TaxID=694068 RepID=UPI00044079ED|nr:PLP-dependent transferase [Fomitiporia mediterranea MF3/22]EJD08165.1 PLP-dependent transferase [Fomitiporia mediterranea MF3/22]